MSKNIHYKLKSLRVEHDLTQEKLSEYLDMHEVTYNRKELGIREFSLNEAKKIADLFKLSIEDVFFTDTVQFSKTTGSSLTAFRSKLL